VYAIERRQWLIERARERGRLDVAAISEELSLAAETIRRDLNALQEQGMLRRVYGGAVAVERLRFESALTARATRHPEEKRRIASAAVTYLGTAEAIFLDEGYLPQLVAERLHPTHPITVVTGSLPIATSLAERPNVEVIVIGGRLRATTLGCVDQWAVNTLLGLVLDLAIIGANGMSVEHGATVPDGQIATVKATAMRSARRRLLVADSSKYGSDSFASFAKLSEFERLVTDTNLTDAAVQQIEATGLAVSRV
jgi:DeoR family transcriptional regulator, fructose operon transcriptional repressor